MLARNGGQHEERIQNPDGHITSGCTQLLIFVLVTKAILTTNTYNGATVILLSTMQTKMIRWYYSSIRHVLCKETICLCEKLFKQSMELDRRSVHV